MEQRRSLLQAHVALDDVADLATFDRWVECGLDPQAAIADDHAGCQDLAAWLVAEGYTGVLAPSAALPDNVNLTVFGGRYEHVAVDDPRALPARDSAVWLRVALAAAGAHPPVELVPRTRYRGKPHGGYDDWESARA